MNKTIFITVFHSFISKNFLNTAAFEELRRLPNVTYVLLVPETKKDFFTEEYSMGNVVVEGVDTAKILDNRMVKKHSALSHLLVKSFYLWYKKVERRDRSTSPFRYIKYFGENAFTWLFGNSKWGRTVFRKSFLEKVHVSFIEELFKKYDPSLIFASDVFDETDSLVMAESRRRGVPIVGMVRSWDNCFSKGVMRVVPELLMVNNLELKKEAIYFHDVPEESIEVVGLPQYDSFVNDVRTPREEFFKSVGLDPLKKLILYSPAGAILSDTDVDICHILKKAIVNHEITEPAQVLARNHPHHPANLDEFFNDKDIVVDYPGKRFGKNLKDAEITKAGVTHLGDSLYYADVVVYTATTLGIDSLMFDKPQIVIDFDGYKTKKYTQSVRRYHHEDHMKKMLDLNGTTIAESKEELIKAINDYLKDPTLKKEGRERMRKQQIHFFDGKSGERVAEFLKKAIIES